MLMSVITKYEDLVDLANKKLYNKNWSLPLSGLYHEGWDQFTKEVLNLWEIRKLFNWLILLAQWNNDKLFQNVMFFTVKKGHSQRSFFEVKFFKFITAEFHWLQIISWLEVSN